MKKFKYLLVLVSLFSLAGCGNKEGSTNTNKEPEKIVVNTPETLFAYISRDDAKCDMIISYSMPNMPVIHIQIDGQKVYLPDDNSYEYLKDGIVYIVYQENNVWYGEKELDATDLETTDANAFVGMKDTDFTKKDNIYTYSSEKPINLDIEMATVKGMTIEFKEDSSVVQTITATTYGVSFDVIYTYSQIGEVNLTIPEYTLK